MVGQQVVILPVGVRFSPSTFPFAPGLSLKRWQKISLLINGGRGHVSVYTERAVKDQVWFNHPTLRISEQIMSLGGDRDCK